MLQPHINALATTLNNLKEFYSIAFHRAQECPVLLLNGQCPAELSSNLTKPHALKLLAILKTMISWLRCVYLGLELNSIVTLQEQDWTALIRLLLKLSTRSA